MNLILFYASNFVICLSKLVFLIWFAFLCIYNIISFISNNL